MKRAFIDSSVLIAAMLSNNGGSAVILRLSKNKKLFGIISASVLEEVFSKSKKIGKGVADISNFVDEHGLIVRDKVTEDEIEPYTGVVADPNDAHVIAGAKLTKCEFLITLDKKHLLNSTVKKSVSPLKVMLPKEFLENLAKSN